MSKVTKDLLKRKAETVASVTSLNISAAAVSPARLRRRHFGLIVSFFFVVAVPTLGVLFYMFEVAEDQYLSRVSFSIRSEEALNPLDALSSLGQISSGTSSDASILNEYLRSQKLVEDVVNKLDLKALYSKPEYDPLFSFDPKRPLEDLVEYFQRMNSVTFDSSNGLLDVHSFGFSAIDAELVATAILEASNELVEHLSRVAQNDTTKAAKFELERARVRLSETRLVLGELRLREQVIDPMADLNSQMGVLRALQSQLADALIENDLLLETSLQSDPRLTAIERKVSAIESRIESERSKLAKTSSNGQNSLASVVGEFESLSADREFAERAYQAASAAYEAAQAEARRKSKYLVAHIPPTRAESSQYPNRLLWVLGFLGCSLLIWSVAVLTIFAMLDRR